MSKKKAYTEKYWICEFCAAIKGWKIPKSNAMGLTVISGYCGHCKDNQVRMLIPVLDYERGGVKPWFD